MRVRLDGLGLLLSGVFLSSGCCCCHPWHGHHCCYADAEKGLPRVLVVNPAATPVPSQEGVPARPGE